MLTPTLWATPTRTGRQSSLAGTTVSGCVLHVTFTGRQVLPCTYIAHHEPASILTLLLLLLFSLSPLRLQSVVIVHVQSGCCLAAFSCDAALFLCNASQCNAAQASATVIMLLLLQCWHVLGMLEWVIPAQAYLLPCVLQLVGVCS